MTILLMTRKIVIVWVTTYEIQNMMELWTDKIICLHIMKTGNVLKHNQYNQNEEIVTTKGLLGKLIFWSILTLFKYGHNQAILASLCRTLC